jgi:hypothetical protein
MEKDLFGNKVKKKRKTRLENSLKKYDSSSFEDRLQRLTFLNNIFPKGYGIIGDQETVYVFSEAKMAFINGEFISSILLAQAFIERKLQIHYKSFGLEKVAKRGLKSIIDYARKNNLLNSYLIDKIDSLRKKRNPFLHIKPYDYEFNLSQRIFNDLKNSKTFRQPIEILEADAKDAISLMYTIFITDLKKINSAT